MMITLTWDNTMDASLISSLISENEYGVYVFSFTFQFPEHLNMYMKLELLWSV